MTVPCINSHEKMRSRTRVLMPRMAAFMGELEPSSPIEGHSRFNEAFLVG